MNISPYQKRPVRFLELIQDSDWKIKLYGIRYQGPGDPELPSAEVVEAVKAFAVPRFPQPATTNTRHGAGFLIVHQGQDAIWILLDWWENECMLMQRLFSAPLEQPERITPIQSELIACTWELGVHLFERKAWMETVLRAGESASLEAYCARRFGADV